MRHNPLSPFLPPTSPSPSLYRDRMTERWLSSSLPYFHCPFSALQGRHKWSPYTEEFCSYTVNQFSFLPSRATSSSWVPADLHPWPAEAHLGLACLGWVKVSEGSVQRVVNLTEQLTCMTPGSHWKRDLDLEKRQPAQ